jgi:transcriptional regulator with XRE-family HTH domain
MSSSEIHDPGALELGSKLRSRRGAAGLTLQEVAEATGVSRSFLSQVERGLVSPSIASLRRIADALGTPMAALFVAGDEAGATASAPGRPVVARHERRRLQATGSPFTYELLTRSVDGAIEFMWGYFDPGASAPEPGADSVHAGEEVFVCVRGSIVFTIDGEEHILEEGDSIGFDCTLPHRIENRGHTRAELVIAITPPSF